MLPTDQARSAPSRQREGECAELIRVRGLVQGVGFRPAVWRLAHEYGLRGWVGNDGAGVSALLCGAPNDIVGLVDALMRAPLALARIDAIEREPAAVPSDCADFRIVDSHTGSIHTGVVPDAAICPDCRQEILDPAARRFRYPFANCTQCGPRLSIIEAIPYDRGATTMRPFRMCPDCAAEYGNPADRRFHAQPIACPACGPRIWLEPAVPNEDAIEAAGALLLAGGIVAIKALGGFHLACDATNAAAVARLRQAKHRDAKPFALMARDIALIQRYARVAEADAAALSSPVAPIVLLQGAGDTAPPRLEEAGVIHSGSRHSARPVLQGIAPGLSSLGFMLPGTPLHHLLLSDIDRPLVMTSGNLSDEPQCITNDEARSKLRGIADHILLHDRDIARRVDDSVVRVAGGATRVLRRARGYAPAPLPLPHGFAAAPSLLAMGGELKSTFALRTRRGGSSVAPHGRSGKRPDLRRLPALDRAIPHIVRPYALRHRRRLPPRLPGYEARPRARQAGCAAGLRGAAPSRASGRLHDGKRRAARHGTGAGHRARRARLGRRQHDLGRRVPARRLSWLPQTGLPQAGGDAGGRAGRSRAVAQRLRTDYRGDRLASLHGDLWEDRIGPRSLGQAGGGAGPDDRPRRQRAVVQFLRPTVRRGCRRSRAMPRQGPV